MLPLALLAGVATQLRAEEPRPAATTDFAGLILHLSEDPGKFHSDNFVSNEPGYPSAIEGLRALGIHGGAYIGVGPEQNFSYLAALQPERAFVVDIRRENTVQHLMYKALFAAARNRLEFLELLLSRPPPNAPEGESSRAAMSVQELLTAVDSRGASMKACEQIIDSVSARIEENFGFPLTDKDRVTLRHIHSAFAEAGLSIHYSSPKAVKQEPTLRELMLARDTYGNHVHFLASEKDFQFVKQLHARDRIVPVTGDFAGRQALRKAGEFVRDRGEVVSAFYLSNVEQYLRGAQYAAFVENVRRLPLNDRSVLIRCAFEKPTQRLPGDHSEQADGQFWPHALLLQRAQRFVELYDEGAFLTHEDLARQDYLDWTSGR